MSRESVQPAQSPQRETRSPENAGGLAFLVHSHDTLNLNTRTYIEGPTDVRQKRRRTRYNLDLSR